MDVVILLRGKKEVPAEPTVELPAPPDMPTLGKTSSDVNGLSDTHNDRLKAFKAKWRSERDNRMERGEGDK